MSDDTFDGYSETYSDTGEPTVGETGMPEVRRTKGGLLKWGTIIGLSCIVMAVVWQTGQAMFGEEEKVAVAEPKAKKKPSKPVEDLPTFQDEVPKNMVAAAEPTTTVDFEPYDEIVAAVEKATTPPPELTAAVHEAAPVVEEDESKPIVKTGKPVKYKAPKLGTKKYGATEAADGAGNGHGPVISNIGGRDRQTIDERHPYERYLERMNDEPVKTAYASQLKDLGSLLEQSRLLEITIDGAINSDLPGMFRGTVSRDYWSFDGQWNLVAAGTKAVGQYQAVIDQYQRRIGPVWKRLIREDGVTIEFSSPGVDELARAGVVSGRDVHFLERFGGALLLKLVEGVVAAAVESTGPEGGGNVSVQGGGQATTDIAAIALKNSINIPPTLFLHPGEKVYLFVGQDWRLPPMYSQVAAE